MPRMLESPLDWQRAEFFKFDVCKCIVITKTNQLYNIFTLNSQPLCSIVSYWKYMQHLLLGFLFKKFLQNFFLACIWDIFMIFSFLSFPCKQHHRLETLVHFIARAPFKPGHLKSNWAWRDDDLPPLPEPELLDKIRRRRDKRIRSRTNSAGSNSSNTTDQKQPLLSEHSGSSRGVSFT